MLAGSVRTFSSEDQGDKAKVVEKESEKKKQLKSDDLLRILSLAKPEYKSLAGTCKFVLFFSHGEFEMRDLIGGKINYPQCFLRMDFKNCIQQVWVKWFTSRVII